MAETDLHTGDTPRNPVPVELTKTTRKPQRDRLATAVEVANWIKAGGIVRHGCGQSLWLQVRGATSSWMLRYRHAGQAKSLGLGACDLSGKRGLKLVDARAAADAALALLRQDIDPAADRQAKLAAVQADAAATKAAANAAKAPAVTFRMVARDYIEQHDAGWKSVKHAKQWLATLEAYVFPLIGDLPPDAVTVDHVLQIIRPIWASKPQSASRVRGRVESILAAAKVRGLRSGENVARWPDNLDHLLPRQSKVHKVRHQPAARWQDLPGMMVTLTAKPGQAGRALRLLILTAARSGEIRGMRWSEVDLTERVWTVPAARMKGGRMHRVPLSDPAVRLLLEQRGGRTPQPDELVFPSKQNTPLSDMTLTALLRGIGWKDPAGDGITAHGFRSSFRDWCAETGKPADIAEQALAHAAGDRVTVAYLRSDMLARRTALLAEWGAHCCPNIADDRVVPLRRAP